MRMEAWCRERGRQIRCLLVETEREVYTGWPHLHFSHTEWNENFQRWERTDGEGNKTRRNPTQFPNSQAKEGREEGERASKEKKKVKKFPWDFWDLGILSLFHTSTFLLLHLHSRTPGRVFFPIQFLIPSPPTPWSFLAYPFTWIRENLRLGNGIRRKIKKKIKTDWVEPKALISWFWAPFLEYNLKLEGFLKSLQEFISSHFPWNFSCAGRGHVGRGVNSRLPYSIQHGGPAPHRPILSNFLENRNRRPWKIWMRALLDEILFLVDNNPCWPRACPWLKNRKERKERLGLGNLERVTESLLVFLLLFASFIFIFWAKLTSSLSLSEGIRPVGRWEERKDEKEFPSWEKEKRPPTFHPILLSSYTIPSHLLPKFPKPNSNSHSRF